MAKEITVDVDSDGSVSIDANGFSGADCEEATRFLEEALGKEQIRKRKPEYYRPQKRRKINKVSR